MMADDPLPQILAEIDQTIASMPLIARLLRAQFEASLAEGFTEPQALQITIGYHRSLTIGS